MPPTSSIPQFLLPQRGAIWRTRLCRPSSTSLTNRHASKASSKAPKNTNVKPGGKPLVLEKPTKFNPPSHGARLRKEAPRYPGPQLSAEEAAVQRTKKYPNMMPPEGSFLYWFINNRSIHLFISLGTLFGLACTVWISNFKANSPFAEMLPAWSQLLFHPIVSLRTFFEVVKMNSDYITAETMERRKRKVEDVAKRAAYRKAHGLDQDDSFGGWTAKTDEQILGPGITIGDAEGAKEGQAQVVREKRPLKKWLGIW
ncbi:unnamed protein product [Diplocarpon coronariae]|uniref:Uncharacterized protein n=1 Tax=Diplocarpon coronariae TaxID=2795749 RepID=A0A218YXJ6_9HELO|nr:hypothetical protein JHW43_003080 [Diplocarpon mali]OWP00541.1 hypothetical protein B2J93_4290 [Marssonina coronariae]